MRGATGRPVQHHRTYELTLWDGRIYRTRISKPVDGTTYGAKVWGHILREQLHVTADEFWSCAQDGLLPDRGQPAPRAERKAVPLHLVRALQEFGVSEDEIFALDPAGAAELLAKFYTGDAQ
ncbi:cytotoxic translational repressor of toxin-antitoxin stability system [Leifsonia sp. Leaf264]|uniref:cytotoxic translational repressor of toxin-antitoxin stability system n=1 Tax=Leifsonia sp. Leaf264 TaxID=1736314 RepID=UPI001910324D|nr:cytotoxic translational repressor of toxin-antitoxin stability system [Leifsonia sp. Leaf264]